MHANILPSVTLLLQVPGVPASSFCTTSPAALPAAALALQICSRCLEPPRLLLAADPLVICVCLDCPRTQPLVRKLDHSQLKSHVHDAAGTDLAAWHLHPLHLNTHISGGRRGRQEHMQAQARQHAVRQQN